MNYLFSNSFSPGRIESICRRQLKGDQIIRICMYMNKTKWEKEKNCAVTCTGDHDIIHDLHVTWFLLKKLVTETLQTYL